MKKKYTCGNCGKQYDDHFHEDEVYCNEYTNGDIFSSEPSHSELCIYLATYHSDFFINLIKEWKIANGHLNVDDYSI